MTLAEWRYYRSILTRLGFDDMDPCDIETVSPAEWMEMFGCVEDDIFDGVIEEEPALVYWELASAWRKAQMSRPGPGPGNPMRIHTRPRLRLVA